MSSYFLTLSMCAETYVMISFKRYYHHERYLEDYFYQCIGLMIHINLLRYCMLGL